MVKFRILALAALLSAALLVSAAPASAGECVDVTVRYELLGMGERTAADGCVGPSIFNNQAGHVGPIFGVDRDLVFVYVEIWHPVP